MSTLKTSQIQSLTGSILLNNTGSILQVKQAFLDTTWTGTTTIAAGGSGITGLSVSITPTSASNKILLWASVNGNGQATVTQIYTWFVRNSTKIGAGQAAGSRIGVASRYYLNDSNVNGMCPMVYLDSPGTTSAVTYTVYAGTEGSGTVYVNRTQSDTDGTSNGARGSSVLIAMEVVG